MKNRKYKRFNFQKVINAHLKIKEYKGTSAYKNKYAQIEILNIGIGGVCFVSTLDLPCDKDFLVKITFGQEVVTGYIVWKHKNPDNYVYGLETTSATVGFLKFNMNFEKYN